MLPSRLCRLIRRFCQNFWLKRWPAIFSFTRSEFGSKFLKIVQHIVKSGAFESLWIARSSCSKHLLWQFSAIGGLFFSKMWNQNWKFAISIEGNCSLKSSTNFGTSRIELQAPKCNMVIDSIPYAILTHLLRFTGNLHFYIFSCRLRSDFEKFKEDLQLNFNSDGQCACMDVAHPVESCRFLSPGF